MNDESSRHGSVTLRPRARIIRTIGRDLISNEVVALVELIKNAYDADASKVRIVFEEPLQSSEGGILIEDNGVGMSLETIKQAWFEPATISKIRSTTSPGGRRVTGEKGIGRFAAARIAQIMEMESVAKGGKHLVRVRLDWRNFEDESLYLDQVKCRWDEISAPISRKHGTTLHLIGLNDEWDEGSFIRLHGELSKLISPYRVKNDFKIVLALPEKFKEYAGVVTPPPILGKPHYKLIGGVDAQGTLTATYEGPDTKEPVSVSEKIIIKGNVPTSGSFRFELRVWDRDNLDPLADELGSTIRKLRQDLNSACGISIYRDDFRVLLPNNDWLRLDIRRVQNPTMRLSSNQIVGAVFISADENEGLRDQTNREGIVSSIALEDFKDALIEVLSKLEVKRDNYRRGQRPQKLAIGLFEVLDIAPLREYVEKRYPQDAELRAFLGEKTQAFEHGIAEVQQVLARYRRLATLGQLIDVVLHEGRTPVAAISNEVTILLRDAEHAGSEISDKNRLNIFKRLSVIAQQTKVLSMLFNRLAPFSGRKRGRPTEIAIEEIISNICELYKWRIDELHVNVNLPAGITMIKVDQSEIQQIFVNLLDNALYWLEKVPNDKRSIDIKVSRRPEQLVITFSDSGPGVPEDVSDRIFDPYFSTKPDGVGLGLTIAGETAAEYDGALELVSGGSLPGATFRIVLKKGIGAI